MYNHVVSHLRASLPLALFLGSATLAVAQTISPNWVAELSRPGWNSSFGSVVATKTGACVQTIYTAQDNFWRSSSEVRKYDLTGRLRWIRSLLVDGLAAAAGSRTVACRDGSVWAAALFNRTSGDTTLILRRFDQRGKIRAFLQRELAAYDPVVEMVATSDGGLAVALDAGSKRILRLSSDGGVLREATIESLRLLTIGPDGESFWGTVLASSPPEYVLVKYDEQGEVSWTRRFPIGLNRLSDVLGQQAATDGATVVTTMGAYEELPERNEFWHEVAALRASDGAVIARRRRLEPDWAWAPKPVLHPFGGAVLERWPVERLAPDLSVAWSLTEPPFKGHLSVEGIDRAGNVWLLGSARDGLLNHWAVHVLDSDGKLSGSSLLRLAESSIASQVAFDPIGRGYVLGTRGPWSRSTVLLAQYPALNR
jgi:hypothetical protein